MLVVILLLQAFLLAAENPGIGTDIHNYTQSLLESKKLGKPELITQKDGWSDLTVIVQGVDDTYSLLSARLEGGIAFPFGYMEKSGGKVIYGFDFDADTLIDTYSDLLVVPYYFYAISRDLKRGDDKLFLDVCDRIYNVFVGNAGPREDPDMADIFKLLEEVKKDMDVENRDLFYALWFYQRFSRIFHYSCIKSMEYLLENVSRRFDKNHPLFHLYRLETHINSGLTYSARNFIKQILEEFPDCIPVRVYDYTIGDHSNTEKREILKGLKKKYPGHWIVKTLEEKE